MLVKIYALVDPKDGRIRYIGKTRYTLAKRLAEHCQDRRMRHNRHKINWIRLLESEGMRPLIRLLEECQESDWQEREKFWIALHRATVTNVTDGGNGSSEIRNRVLLGPQREQISATLKEYYRENTEARQRCGAAGRACQGVPKRIPNKTSKYVGVVYTKGRKTPLKRPWAAFIRVNRKAEYLGIFSTQEEAARAYDVRAKQLGYTRFNLGDPTI